MKNFLKENFLIYLIILLAFVAVCSPNKPFGQSVFILLLLAVLSIIIIYSLKFFQLFRKK
ncbi:hypothetical protein EKS16_02245 [Streptococcus mutans]|nr:hypothetical protein [Streptococcus mutans]